MQLSTRPSHRRLLKSSLTAAVVLFSAVGLPLSLAQTKQAPAEAAAPPPQAKGWEYKSVRIPVGSTSSLDMNLNRLGADGWEVCVVDETRNVWVFKRPQT